jgi:D-tyrosyl-tRNA(Tyr) deacylase
MTLCTNGHCGVRGLVCVSNTELFKGIDIMSIAILTDYGKHYQVCLSGTRHSMQIDAPFIHSLFPGKHLCVCRG